MAAVVVELVFGSGAVGVDPVDHLRGEDAQLGDGVDVGEPDQQLFPFVDVGGVEAAPVDLRQRPFDDRHLLRAHPPGLLRRRQMRPERGQGLAEHAGPLTHRRRGPDPPGCFTRGQPEHTHQHPDHRRLGQRLRQVPRLGVADQGMVDERDPVPGLLQVLHHRNQLRIIEAAQSTFGERFEQVIDTRRDLVHGVIDCGRVVDITPEAHAPILFEYTFDIQEKARFIVPFLTRR